MLIEKFQQRTTIELWSPNQITKTLCYKFTRTFNSFALSIDLSFSFSIGNFFKRFSCNSVANFSLFTIETFTSTCRYAYQPQLTWSNNFFFVGARNRF